MGVRARCPDLVVVVGGRFHALELKRHGGRLSPEQTACHAQIIAAGDLVAVAHGVDEALTVLERWRAISAGAGSRTEARRAQPA